MQYLQSPPELLNLGTYTEGDRRKKEIFMRSGRLNPFGKVWSTTHIIGRYILCSFFVLLLFCVLCGVILKSVSYSIFSIISSAGSAVRILRAVVQS